MTDYTYFKDLIWACQWALTIGIVLGFLGVLVKRIACQGWAAISRLLLGASVAASSPVVVVFSCYAVVGCGFCCEYFWDWLCLSF